MTLLFYRFGWVVVTTLNLVPKLYGNARVQPGMSLWSPKD